MGFLRRLTRKKDAPAAPLTPGQLLDALQERRDEAEIALRQRYPTCPKCASDYLRVGVWASKGRAGWTVTCVNCGLLLEKTVEIESG
jgi:hypothetical protein